LCTEDVVSDRDVVDKDALQFVSLSTEDFVLLKSFKVVNCKIADNWFRTALRLNRHNLLVLALLKAKFSHSFLSFLLRVGLRLPWLVLTVSFTINKFNSVGVDDAVARTLNFKVVGNQVDWASLHQCLLGALGLVAESAGVASRRVAASTIGTGGLRLIAIATLTLTAHITVTAVLLAATLAVMASWLLHVARVEALVLTAHVWRLLRTDVLAATMSLIGWAALIAVRLLVGLLIVVGVLHLSC